MKQNFFFQIATWIFKEKCSLESDVYFIEHCNFVADDKEQLDVFDKSVATVLLSFETIKHQDNIDFNLMAHAVSCCFFNCEVLSVLLSKFLVFVIIISMKTEG